VLKKFSRKNVGPRGKSLIRHKFRGRQQKEDGGKGGGLSAVGGGTFARESNIIRTQGESQQKGLLLDRKSTGQKRKVATVGRASNEPERTVGSKGEEKRRWARPGKNKKRKERRGGLND